MSTQIHDLGYRAYQGERAGVGWAIRSLAVHSIRRALGLKRAGKHKIVPILTILIAFLPAIVLVGLSAFIPDFGIGDFFVSYGDYFGFTLNAILLFAAAAAPGVLTTDRTSGMLALYLASPLTRTTYVLAKAIGIFTVMLSVTVAPIIFLVLAYTFVGAGPGGLLDFIELLIRALVAGSLAAALFTGISMFVSSIPKRWGIASVSMIAALLIPSIVIAILFSGTDVSDWIALISPGDVMAEAWQRILGDSIRNVELPALDRLSSTALVGTAVAMAVGFLAATWYRYQTIEVDR